MVIPAAYPKIKGVADHCDARYHRIAQMLQAEAVTNFILVVKDDRLC